MINFVLVKMVNCDVVRETLFFRNIIVQERHIQIGVPN